MQTLVGRVWGELEKWRQLAQARSPAFLRPQAPGWETFPPRGSFCIRILRVAGTLNIQIPRLHPQTL